MNLGRMVGIKVQPFKGKIGFSTPKIGLMDFVSMGSLLGSGGLSGLTNIGKWSTANLLTNLKSNPLLGLQLLNSGGGKGGSNPLSATGLLGQLSTGIGSIGLSELPLLAEASKLRPQVLSQSLQSLSPGGVDQNVARFGQNSLLQAAMAARQGAAGLGQAGAGMQDALYLDALNRANTATQGYDRDQRSVLAEAQRNAGRLSLLDPSSVSPTATMGLNALLGQTQTDAQRSAARNSKRSTLEQILGVASQVDWSKVDWSKVFKF